MQSFDDLFTSRPDQREDVPFDKDSWAEKKQAERKDVYAMIDEYVSEMGSNGDMIRTYLDVQARFDRCSVSNAVLIAAQYPEATRLADFDTWANRGVYVQKGEEAITILEQGKEYERYDGSTGNYCNVKKVFDISQTNSRQRPEPAVAHDDRLLLKALMNNAPCGFEISNELPEGVNVAYNAEKNVIQIRRGLEAPTIFRGLAQELAKAHMDRGNISCESPGFAAYCVSYMLCRRNGISVDNFSFDRLPERYGQMEARELRDEVGVMREIAGEISKDMHRLFQAQEKTQKNRDNEAR